jgi:hypothetical protein
MTIPPELEAELDRLFDELIALQWKKVRAAGDAINPRLTDDDLAQPHDFAELTDSPAWQYEDGVLAGYRSAQMAVRARLRRG